MVKKNEESWLRMVLNTLQLFLIIPFIPIAFATVYFFAWVIKQKK